MSFLGYQLSNIIILKSICVSVCLSSSLLFSHYGFWKWQFFLSDSKLCIQEISSVELKTVTFLHIQNTASGQKHSALTTSSQHPEENLCAAPITVAQQSLVKCSPFTCITEQMVLLSLSTVLVRNPQRQHCAKPSALDRNISDIYCLTLCINSP